MITSKRFHRGPSWKCLLMGVVGITFTAAVPAQGQQPELIVRNGLIVTEDGRREADIRIRGERIVAIGPNLTMSAGARVIEASGMLVLPGAVDTHTHLNAEMPNPPRPNRPQDDYVTGSAAAFAGGVTTISNFIPLQPGEDAAAYADRVIGGIERSAMADFFIHINIGGNPAPFTPDRLKALAGRGFVSTGEDFLARESYDTNSLAWYKTFKASGPAGVLSMLHAEDYAIMAEAQERLMAEGRGSIHNFSPECPGHRRGGCGPAGGGDRGGDRVSDLHPPHVIGTCPASGGRGDGPWSARVRRDAAHVPAPHPGRVSAARRRAVPRRPAAT